MSHPSIEREKDLVGEATVHLEKALYELRGGADPTPSSQRYYGVRMSLRQATNSLNMAWAVSMMREEPDE